MSPSRSSEESCGTRHFTAAFILGSLLWFPGPGLPPLAVKSQPQGTDLHGTAEMH